MTASFSTIPTSYSGLSQEMIRAVDLFRMGQLSEEALSQALAVWAGNTPQFLFSRDDPALLSPQVARAIGKRRATVVTTLLLRRQNSPSSYPFHPGMTVTDDRPTKEGQTRT